MRFSLFQNDDTLDNGTSSSASNDAPDQANTLESIQAAARSAELTVRKAEATARKAEAAAARAEGLVKQVQLMLDEVGKRIEEARILSTQPVPAHPEPLNAGPSWEEKLDKEKFDSDAGIPRVSPFILDNPDGVEFSEA